MHSDHATTHDALEDPRNADILIYVNGTLKHRNEAKVSVYDSGFMLGDGMWEGMRLYDGVWAFFEAHMDRFFDSCKAVSLDVGMDRAGHPHALVGDALRPTRMETKRALPYDADAGREGAGRSSTRPLSQSGPTLVSFMEHSKPLDRLQRRP